jgi:hypothetical protein
VEQSGGPLADYRSAQCRSQAVGRGSCNSMSRSNIRPVCDLRSSADSGSGCPGMSTPLSRAVPLHRCRKDRSWLLAREQPGSFARSITSRFPILDAGYRHLARLIIGAGRSGHLPRRADAYFEDPIRWPSTCATCPQGRASPHAASSPHLLSADSPQPIPSLADAAARPQAGSA